MAEIRLKGFILNGAQIVVNIIALVLHSLRIILRNSYLYFEPLKLKSLKGEIILVTGGSSGIGLTICRELIQREKDVTIIVWNSNQSKGKAAVDELKELGVRLVVGYTVDVSDQNQIEEAAAKVRKEIGDVTMVINNAGIPSNTGIGWEMCSDHIEKVIRVNTIAHLYTIQEFLPAMIKNGKGHIVAISSIVGLTPIARAAPYISSKHGVNAIMSCIKQDVRNLPEKPEIHFTTVFPNITKTPLLEQSKLKLGKYDFFVPDYSPDYVAEKIIRGVLRNEENIYFPGFYLILPFFLGMLPTPVVQRFIQVLNISFD